MHRNVETFLVGNHPSRVGYWKFWAGRIERRARDLIVVMNDGHRQTIPVAEITKIEFKDADIVVFRDGRQKSFRMSETQSFEFETDEHPVSRSLTPQRSVFGCNTSDRVIGGCLLSSRLPGDHFSLCIFPTRRLAVRAECPSNTID
jgi:hypothetical protein